MSQAGAGGPASPPKAPLAAGAKPVSPPTPAVAPAKAVSPPAAAKAAAAEKGVSPSPAKVQPRPAATRVGPPPLPEDERWGAQRVQEPIAPTAPASAPREETHSTVQAAVREAVAPLQQSLREMERRIDALERRSIATAAPHVVVPAAAPQVVYATARTASLPSAAVLDVATIERNVVLDVDVSAFDSGRRRRRLLIAVVIAIVIVFGGLFALLAQSYARHPS